MLNQFSDQILIVTVPETLEMVVEVYWKVTKPMELHYQEEVDRYQGNL